MTAHRSLSRTIRNKFIAGLVIVIPIVLTVKALWWLFTYVDSLAAGLALRMLGRPIPGIGFVITIAVVMLAGVLFSSGPLQRLLHGLEELVDSIPVVGSVYGTTKKVLSGFGKPESQGAFKRFVFARLPGRTTPGFVTSTFHFTRPGQHHLRAVRGLHPDEPPLRRGRRRDPEGGRDRHRPSPSRTA
jgi:uncharacterized membrane protein